MYFYLIVSGYVGLKTAIVEKEAIKFPALGKANDSTDGFIIDDNSGECHMIVTELIYEIVVARKLETTSFELHPTISESVVELIINVFIFK